MRFASVFVVATVASAGALLSQCANLTPLAAGVCGNGVIDPGEDCDGTTHDAGSEQCGAPNAGALACRFDCAGTAQCPTGYNCGVDEICRQPAGTFVALGAPLAVGAVGVTLADFNNDGFADALTRGPLNSSGGSRVQVNYLSATGASIGTFSLADKLQLPSVTDVNGDGIPDVVAALRLSGASGVSVFLGQNSNSLAFQSFPSAVFPTAALPNATSTVRSFALSGFPGSLKTVYFMGSSSGGTYPPGLYLTSTAGLPDVASPTSTNVLPLPEGPDEVVGEVQLVQVYTQVTEATMPCPSLVYETTSGTVRVVSPCQRDADGTVHFLSATSKLPFLTSVTLPSQSATACTSAGYCSPGVQVADVNGDGSPDLLIPATSYLPGVGASALATYVAYGDGNGNFTPAPPNTTAQSPGTAGPAYTLQIEAADGRIIQNVQIGETYAAGDLNGDEVVDFVARSQEYATTGTPTGTPFITFLVSNPSRTTNAPVYESTGISVAWQSAAIADFNGDGLPDVIGGSSATAGLEFFDGVALADGDYVSHEFVVSTAGAVSHFAVGDFDGDNISDLAFQELDPANDGTVDLAICYGSASGTPASPLTIGHYASIAQISSTIPYTDLGLVGSPLGTPDVLMLTRFSTSAGGRPPLSSQALSSSQGTVLPELALAAAASTFSGGAAFDGGVLPSVAAIGRYSGTSTDEIPNTHDLWLLIGEAHASSGGLALGSPVSATSHLPINFWPDLELNNTTNQALLVAAAPLRPNDPASFVAVASDSLHPTQSVLLIARASNGSSPTLAPTNLAGDLAPTLYATGSDAGTPVSPPVAEDGQLALVDLDGDGSLDLILLTGTATSNLCNALAPLPPATATARSLLVLWGDGNGGFSMTSPTTVATCAGVTSCTSPESADCPQAFTTLATQGGGNPTLAYVTHASVELAQFSASTAQARTHPSIRQPVSSALDGGTRDAAGPRDGSSPLPANLSGYTGIAGGDVNGDGVDDFAVTVNGSLYVYVGVPVLK